MPAPIKPSISIIGTGRLGGALALGLQRSRYPVVGLVARHFRRAEATARLLRLDAGGQERQLPTVALGAKDLKQLPLSDIVLICTPDDEIAQLAETMARHASSRTVLHTSGALSSAALAPLARVGVDTGSLHPLVSVSDSRSGAEAFAGAFFCVEGDARAVRIGRRIVRDLKGSAFSIPSERKSLYHAAAVMASPHATTLFDVAVSTLSAAGLNRETARKVLIPLLESTVHNLKQSDAADALTGTFARGDVATVKRHLEALSGAEHRQAREIYKLIGLHALTLARKKGLDQKLINAIKKLLK